MQTKTNDKTAKETPPTKSGKAFSCSYLLSLACHSKYLPKQKKVAPISPAWTPAIKAQATYSANKLSK